MSSTAQIQKAFNGAYETGKSPFHPCTFHTDDGGEVEVTGVTYRRWLIGQCLMGAAPSIWSSVRNNEDVADSIVSLVDAIIKRERK